MFVHFGCRSHVEVPRLCGWTCWFLYWIRRNSRYVYNRCMCSVVQCGLACEFVMVLYTCGAHLHPLCTYTHAHSHIHVHTHTHTYTHTQAELSLGSLASTPTVLERTPSSCWVWSFTLPRFSLFTTTSQSVLSLTRSNLKIQGDSYSIQSQYDYLLWCIRAGDILFTNKGQMLVKRNNSY